MKEKGLKIATSIILLTSGSVFTIDSDISFVLRFIAFCFLILMIFFLITSKRFSKFMRELKKS